jgi:rhodanese-related sulfurtransferase
MAEQPYQTRCDELLAEFRETRAVMRAFVESRSEAERAARGTPQQWSAKDVLAAAGFWMDYMVERMGYFERGEPAPKNVDFEALNLRTFETHADIPWQTVVDSAERSLDNLIAATQRFPDAEFAALNSYDDNEPGGPLFGEVQANGFIWPLQEFEKYYLRMGEAERAAAVRAQLEAVTGKEEPIVCDLIAPAAVQAAQQAAQSPLVIDVRDAKEYARGHVAGAVNIPLDSLEGRLGELAPDRPVVTYCNMHHPGQSRGERAAALLHARGYRASALNGGFPAWREAGLPVDESQ